MNLIRGDERPDEDALEAMKNSPANHPGTRWAVYQNHDLGHPHLGHLRFLAVGPHNTVQEAPQRHPDIPGEICWRYLLVGYVNLRKGTIDSLPTNSTESSGGSGYSLCLKG